MDVESRNTIGLLAPQGVVHMPIMAYWYQSSCQTAGLRMLSRLGTYHTLERGKNVKPMRLRYDNCRICMSRTWPCGYIINMSVGRIQYVCVLAAPLCRCAMWRLCPSYHRPTTHHISLLDPPPLTPLPSPPTISFGVYPIIGAGCLVLSHVLPLRWCCQQHIVYVLNLSIDVYNFYISMIYYSKKRSVLHTVHHLLSNPPWYYSILPATGVVQRHNLLCIIIIYKNHLP